MIEKCRLCNSDKLNEYTKVRKWKLLKCKSCGLVQVVNQPSAEELQDIYSANYFSDSKYADIKTLHKEYDFRLNLMKKYIPLQSNILDYGCAKADFINYAKTSFHFYGIDFSEDAINYAKNTFKDIEKNILYYNEFDNIPDKSLNGVVLWDVIEHLWDFKSIVRSLSNKLIDNSYLIISTPKIDALFAKITKKYWPFMTPPEHLSFFGKKSFIKMAELLNFEVIEIKSKGKWVNIAFMLYKIKRIFPKLISSKLINLFKMKYTSNLSIYIPTNDIQYIVLKKK